MDQHSPGYPHSSHQQAPYNTVHCLKTTSTETHMQDAAPLSANRPNTRNPAVGPADVRFVSSNSAPESMFLSTHKRGSQCSSTSPAAALLRGHPDHMQERHPLPQIPSIHSDIPHHIPHAPYRNGKPEQARNTTAPTAYRPLYRGSQQQVALGLGHQQSSASHLFPPSSSIEQDQHTAPSLSTRTNHNPKELLILKGNGYVPAASTVAGTNGRGRSQEIQRSSSPQPDFSLRAEYDPEELFFFKGSEGQKDDTAQPGLNSLSSSRTRVPTPGLGHIPGPERTGQVASYRGNKPGPSPATRGFGFGIESTGYYDYSEGFYDSSTWFPHMSTRPTLVASPGRIEPHRIRMPCEDDEDDFPDPDVAHQYHFANLPIHGDGEQMKPEQPAYSNRGVVPSYYQPPRVPIREYEYGDTYGAHPHGRPPRTGPLPHQNRGGDPCAYPYQRNHRMAYQDGSGHRGRRWNDGGYHGEQHDAGRYHREGSDVGGRYRGRRDVDNSSNQENMAPSLLTQSSRRAECPSRGTSRTRRNITHAHRKVHEMMRTWIPHGQGSGFRDNDGASIHLSHPIPLAAPRPVSSNTRQRLEEHVLSINDDETLPDEFRNLQNGPPGSSDVDGLSDTISHRLVPVDLAGFGVNGLRRPRILGSGIKQFSQWHAAPCPVETQTELEYQGNVQVEPESDSNAESRSIVRSERSKWGSAKDKLGCAKESMFARLGIKTRWVRNTKASGHTLLTRGAEKGISGFSNSDNPYVELDDSNITRIERWREHSAGDDGQGGDTPDQTGDLQPSMTTGAGHSATFPSLKERLMHLKGKGKALRSGRKL